jgi:large subunit ribosomal protein L17
MRHGKKFNHLKRKSAHRKALLRNLSIALITHKRITTTLAKAKALRKYVEPLVTKAKANTTHSRRVVFSYLQNKEAIKELFGPIADKVADRPGGYVRVIKLGFRRSDGAEMAMIEFVDYNEVYNPNEDKGEGGGSRRRRRSRRGGGGGSESTAAATATETAAEEEEEIEEEDMVDEIVDEVEETTEEATDEETAEEADDTEEEKDEEEK